MLNTPQNRKKRDTGKKRQSILDGAVKVFGEHGFDISSMDEIAEVAGVSKRTIYNHFPSKEKLFEIIVEEFLQPIEKIKPIKYSNAVSLDNQLKEFILAELYLINDPTRRKLSKMLTSVFLMKRDFGKKIYSQYEPHKAFITWLGLAKQDKKLDFESPEIAAQIFYGLIEGCLTWNALLTDGESLENNEMLLNEIVRVFLSCYGFR